MSGKRGAGPSRASAQASLVTAILPGLGHALARRTDKDQSPLHAWFARVAAHAQGALSRQDASRHASQAVEAELLRERAAREIA